MIGQSFGNYQVKSLIGEGGMGVVYLAEHATIGRRAAVKILRPGLTDNPELARRFFNEARAANAIRHPGIVEVFDSGTLPSGVSYIVMELLEGESLAARLRRVGRLPAAEARALAAQTASALAAAHAAGIVHRDLKPDNLFLTPDDRDASAELVKILDFGIAKLGLDASTSGSVKTRTGSIMGTPAYMSPEQCRGTKELDRRTDIYALGVILYEMVCGRTPFVSEGFGEMVHMHISAPPPPPRSYEPSLPEDLERIILRCLAKEPDERPQTMSELQAALLGRASVTAPPATRAPMTAQAIPTTAPTTFTQAAHAQDVAGLTPSRGFARWVVVGLGLGVVAAAAVWWSGRNVEAPPVTAAATAPPSNPPTPAPPAAPKEPARVAAAIRSAPPGARVVRESDGAVIGMTPFDEKWPSGDGVRKLRLELDGYRTESVSVPLDRGVDLSFTLKPLAPPAPAPTPAKHGKHAPAGATGKKTQPAHARPSPKDEPVPL